MRTLSLAAIAAIVIATISLAGAQDANAPAPQAPPAAAAPAPAAPAAPAQKTLAATMNVHVFPNAGQDASQQSKDESECYGMAKQNTGSDPFELQKQAQQQQQQTEAQKAQVAQSGKGAGAKGAVKGAAAGAVVGEVASDDAGKGAGYGAAAGVVAGRRKAAKAKKGATEEIEKKGQEAQAATAAQIESFKKAFSACLESRKYTVKF